MEGGKKNSGYQNRKLAKEKQRKFDKIIEKTTKLDGFLIKKPETAVQERVSNCVSIVEIHNETTTDNSSLDIQTFNDLEQNTHSDTNNLEQNSDTSANCSRMVNLSENHTNIQINLDPATWKRCDNSTITYLCSRNNFISQNILTDFSLTKKVYTDKIARYLNESVFRRKLQNGEFIRRHYIVYSESNKSIYCAPCRLLGGGSSALATTGYSDWKNVTECLSQHENTSQHRQLDTVLKQQLLGDSASNVNELIISETLKEKNYWIQVLKRVVCIIRKLASRTLPLRGKTQIIGSINNGNFLMAVELVAEFDPFLAAHIEKYGNPGKGGTSYLSSIVFEEIVILMAEKVKQQIFKELREAKYYSISVDSTPDISHTDQLAFIIRYVKNGVPEEHFLKFLENVGQKAEDMEKEIIQFLNENKIEIKNLRGQSYDNARNMSGIYSGLQARIKKINELAHFIPCAAHSMNLVGKFAADCCRDAASFFNFLQELFNFFSSSTSRWLVLTTTLKGRTIKNLSETRWSCRYDACKALYENWAGINKALKKISQDETVSSQIRSQAENINKQMNRLECAFMMTFWKSILERFNATSLKLQSIENDLSIVVEQYKSLIEFVNSMSILYENYESKAKEISFVKEFERKRGRKRKVFHDETIEESELHSNQNFKTKTFNVIISCLSEELKKRLEAYELIYKNFEFLNNLTKYEPKLILENAENLYQIYKNDLDECFIEECVHLGSYLKANKISENSILELSKLIYSKQLETVFPNINTILRIFLCTHVSNCSAERSFSLLKRLKTYLRSTIKEQRLNALAILSIETEFTSNIDYSDIIHDFADKKSRRKL